MAKSRSLLAGRAVDVSLDFRVKFRRVGCSEKLGSCATERFVGRFEAGFIKSHEHVAWPYEGGSWSWFRRIGYDCGRIRSELCSGRLLRDTVTPKKVCPCAGPPLRNPSSILLLQSGARRDFSLNSDKGWQRVVHIETSPGQGRCFRSAARPRHAHLFV